MPGLERRGRRRRGVACTTRRAGEAHWPTCRASEDPGGCGAGRTRCPGHPHALLGPGACTRREGRVRQSPLQLPAAGAGRPHRRSPAVTAHDVLSCPHGATQAAFEPCSRVVASCRLIRGSRWDGRAWWGEAGAAVEVGGGGQQRSLLGVRWQPGAPAGSLSCCCAAPLRWSAGWRQPARDRSTPGGIAAASRGHRRRRSRAGGGGTPAPLLPPPHRSTAPPSRSPPPWAASSSWAATSSV